MAQNQYISKAQYDQTLNDLDYGSCEEVQRQDILDRATGDLEADLAQKFTVPLVPVTGGTYQSMLLATNQKFAVNKVLNAIKAKIKEIIGYDKNRTLTGTIESTEKFINVHGLEYKDQIRGLLNPMIVYGFALQGQAVDAQNPVQHLALSKADNKTDPFSDGGANGGVIY